MDRIQYVTLKSMVIGAGYKDEIDWAASIHEPVSPGDFALKACRVILKGGMKEQIARRLWEEKIQPALINGQNVWSVFHHPGKAAAMEYIWANRRQLFEEYRQATDKLAKLAFLETLPWIGPTTRYHLARNLGMDVCKPDRWLTRIADEDGTTPEEMCRRLSEETGDRIGVVDVVLWRAANLGLWRAEPG